MFGYNCLQTAIVVGIAVTLTFLTTGAAESNDTAPPGILLLNNGNLLEGAVSQAGDFYVVTTPKSEIRVRADRVLFVGNDRAAAYEYQRSQMEPRRPGAERHLVLAAWCIRNELWAQASQELMDARKLDASSPELVRLEQQLAVGTHPELRKEARNDDPVGMAKARSAERKALEAVPHEVSDEALELFMRKVQPILVNNCATSGCHQATKSDGSGFQLDRALVHGQGNRHTTMRNLAAALELINEDSPLQSRLLTVPVRPHGTAKEPIFSARQAQLRRHLEDWVLLVTHAEEPDVIVAGAVEESETVDRAVWIVPEGAAKSVYGRRAPLKRK